MNYFFNKAATITKDINKDSITIEINNSALSQYNLVNVVRRESDFVVVFESDIGEDISILNNIVASHRHVTSVKSVQNYLDYSVRPFVDDMMWSFAAENITMGITQAGVSDKVLALFEKQIAVNNALVSLKSSFDTGSLYVSLAILQWHIDNIINYSDLSPFVTTSRLLGMKNKIEVFLGVPLSS